MTQGEIRFTLMTFLVAVTVGLIMTVFEGGASSFQHALLKLGYLIPALLLTVDMWAHYNRYYHDRNAYGHRELFLDTLILALSYVAFVTLKVVPSGTAEEMFRTYPSRECWIALIAYSVLKTYRAWPMYRSDDATRPRMSWLSLLHLVLLVLILSAWCWQQSFPVHVPVPFAWSGAVFAIIATLYLLFVYKVRWDPLTPMGVFRRWAE